MGKKLLALVTAVIVMLAFMPANIVFAADGSASEKNIDEVSLFIDEYFFPCLPDEGEIQFNESLIEEVKENQALMVPETEEYVPTYFISMKEGGSSEYPSVVANSVETDREHSYYISVRYVAKEGYQFAYYPVVTPYNPDIEVIRELVDENTFWVHVPVRRYSEVDLNTWHVGVIGEGVINNRGRFTLFWNEVKSAKKYILYDETLGKKVAKIRGTNSYEFKKVKPGEWHEYWFYAMDKDEIIKEYHFKVKMRKNGDLLILDLPSAF